MIKKQTASLILCLLMCLILPIQAMAASTDNENEKCSFVISFTAEDKKAADVEFKIYRVADISSSNSFSVTERFKVYPVSYAGINDPANWSKLAQTLSGYVVADKLTADSTAKTTENGRAYFSELPVGLYLVIGSPYTSGDTTYTPQAFMVRMPSMDDDGEWKHDLRSDVKYDITFDSGSDNDNKHDNNKDYQLEILKIWKDGENPNRPHSITVEIYENDDLYDTVVLDKSNNWKYKLYGLNKNSVWTVKEQTVKDGYTVSVERQNNRFVLENTLDDTPPGDTPGGNNPKDKDKNKGKNPNNSSNTNSNRLPQTGLLWWPVPCLLAGGLLIMIIGFICRRGTVDES